MALDATGTPTSPDSIPKYNTAVDPPSGKGFNAAMDTIQVALTARTTALADKVDKPAGIASGEVPVWNGTAWVRSSVTNIGASSLGGAWTAYTPTWEAATTNPAIGNGTLVGRYTSFGKMVVGNATITMGSTTTYGSGVWFLGLPVAAHVSDPLRFFIHLLDADVGERTGLGRKDSVSRVALFSNNGAAVMGIVTATSPQTWAVGDSVAMAFAYEAA